MQHEEKNQRNRTCKSIKNGKDMKSKKKKKPWDRMLKLKAREVTLLKKRRSQDRIEVRITLTEYQKKGDWEEKKKDLLKWEDSAEKYPKIKEKVFGCWNLEKKSYIERLQREGKASGEETEKEKWKWVRRASLRGTVKGKKIKTKKISDPLSRQGPKCGINYGARMLIFSTVDQENHRLLR